MFNNNMGSSTSILGLARQPFLPSFDYTENEDKIQSLAWGPVKLLTSQLQVFLF